MVKVTIQVPEALVGDIYIAVGAALRRGQDELDKATGRPTPAQRNEDDEPADPA